MLRYLGAVTLFGHVPAPVELAMRHEPEGTFVRTDLLAADGQVVATHYTREGEEVPAFGGVGFTAQGEYITSFNTETESLGRDIQVGWHVYGYAAHVPDLVPVATATTVDELLQHVPDDVRRRNKRPTTMLALARLCWAALDALPDRTRGQQAKDKGWLLAVFNRCRELQDLPISLFK